MAYSSPRGKIEKKKLKEEKKYTYYGMNKLNINELKKNNKRIPPEYNTCT